MTEPARRARGGSPYRSPGRETEPPRAPPRPIALGFVVAWFLLVAQTFRTCSGPDTSRPLAGLGVGMVALAVVALVAAGRRGPR